ncbi:MAG: hypothetical protein HFH14_06370 [Lachnospiraceae bacterium]|nr:hypothetical protein [Lachnospiraceae bacterium]
MSGNNASKKKSMYKKTRAIIISATAGAAVLSLCACGKYKGGKDVTVGAAYNYEEGGYITLGDYKGLDINVEVTDDDVAAEVETILETEETYEQKLGQPVDGDSVNIDYTAYVDGQAIEDYSDKDDILTVGEEDYYAEFDSALLLMTTGETKNVDISFPADYDDELVAGKTVNFELKLNYICGNALPAQLTDEFVTSYSEGECTSAAEFNEYIRNSLYQDNVDGIAETAWQTAIENVAVKDYHRGEVETAFEEEKNNYKNISEVIGTTYDDILEQFDMTEDDVEEIAEEVALERMTAKTIAAKENLVMDDESYRNLLTEFMQDDDTDLSSMSFEEIEESYRETYSGEPKEGMFVEYVKKYVSDNANVTGMK